MAKTDYKTIDEYHVTFDKDVQDRMKVIRDLVHQIAPDVEEVISYQIPAFKIGKNFLIYYSAYAKHISLSNPWSETLLKEFESEIKDLVVTKSAIQLPANKPLPLEFIKRLIKFRKEEVLQKK